MEMKDYFDYKEILTYYNILNLGSFIDSKINLIKEYSKSNKSFYGKVLFLDKWINNIKIPIFNEITDYNNFKTIKSDKYDAINGRINRYFSYFDIIENEKDIEDVYEQMLDTLIQIPSEIRNFVEIIPTENQAKFIKNKYGTTYISKNKKNPSLKLNIAA